MWRHQARPMVKILIINVMALYNHGGRAVIKGFIHGVKERVPDAELTFMSSHYNSERSVYSEWNYDQVKIIPHYWFRERKGFVRALLASAISAPLLFVKMNLYQIFYKILPLTNPYQEYDVIIDLTTDGPSDNYSLYMTLFSLFNIYLASLSGKPMLICAASIGIFKNSISRNLAKYVLSRVDVITVREVYSMEYLKEIAIEKPQIYLVADQAFLMGPASEERINTIFLKEGLQDLQKPIIGITVNHITYRYAFPEIQDPNEKKRAYNNVTKRLIEHIITTYNATVLLIPHATGVNYSPEYDGKALSREIYSNTPGEDRLRMIQGDYDSDEVKGIIGQCDLFFGSRMHSTIAATSLGVPTIAIVYGHKSHGIIGKMMGQENCIVEVEKHNPDDLFQELVEKFDYIWRNQSPIRNELREKTQETRKKAFLVGKYLEEIINKNPTG